MDRLDLNPLPQPDEIWWCWGVSNFPASVVLLQYGVDASTAWSTFVTWYGENEYGEHDHESRADAEHRVKQLLGGEWKAHIGADAIADWEEHHS